MRTAYDILCHEAPYNAKGRYAFIDIVTYYNVQYGVNTTRRVPLALYCVYLTHYLVIPYYQYILSEEESYIFILFLSHSLYNQEDIGVVRTDFVGKSILTLIALVVLTLFSWYKRRDAMAIPLAPLGLSDNEWLHYLYLVTIENSTRNSLHSEKTSAESVRNFIQRTKVSACPICKRWFIDDVGYCPWHNMALRPRTNTELFAMIAAWEEFKTAYCEHVHVNAVARSTILKLYRVFRQDIPE